MKFKYFFLAMSLVGVAAHAGKAERDFVTSDVEPRVKQAVAALKTSCGCDVKFEYKVENFQTIDELRTIMYVSSQFIDNVGKYCNDAPSKAAVCKMKTVEITKAKEATFKFSGSKGVATTEGNTTPSWDMIAKEVDK